MELSTNVPSWDEISAVLKSKMKYAAASLERAKQTYNVFNKSCCNACIILVKCLKYGHFHEKQFPLD